MERDTHKFWQSGQCTLDGEYQKTERYPYYQLRLKTVADIIRSRGGARVLDIGCGGGHIALMCAMMGLEVFACDYSSEQVSIARAKFAEFGFAIPTIQANILDLAAYPARFFDVILAMSPLEYVPKSQHPQAYREMKRILQPSGYVVNQVINSMFDFGTFNRFTVNFWKERIWPEYFTPEETERLGEDMKKLLAYPEKPDLEGRYATTRDQVLSTTENPITYAQEAREYGFEEVDRIYSHIHLVPPLMTELGLGDTMEHRAYRFEETHCRHWTGMFMAGDFISVLIPT